MHLAAANEISMDCKAASELNGIFPIKKGPSSVETMFSFQDGSGTCEHEAAASLMLPCTVDTWHNWRSQKTTWLVYV